jgi:hypothetical protein
MILHSKRKGNDCIWKLRCHCIQILHSDIYSVLYNQKMCVETFIRPLPIKSRFFKNCELYWSNLPQNSNLGRESFVQKSRVQIPVGGVNFFAIFLFFFTSFILSVKNWILKHELSFLYINRSHRNKIEFVQYTYFYWYLISKRR